MGKLTIVRHELFQRTVIESGLLTLAQVEKLEERLDAQPDAGVSIGRRLRKIRVPAKGKGTSGGARVVYLWRSSIGTLHLLFGFSKSDQENLTNSQIRLLESIIKAIEE